LIYSVKRKDTLVKMYGVKDWDDA